MSDKDIYTLDELTEDAIKIIEKLSPEEKKEWRDTLDRNLLGRKSK
jgi:hypothetical protein